MQRDRRGHGERRDANRDTRAIQCPRWYRRDRPQQPFGAHVDRHREHDEREHDREHTYARDLRTVTANTRADGIEFLRLAERLQLIARITTYDFTGAATAVADLRSGRASGSLVLTFQKK